MIFGGRSEIGLEVAARLAPGAGVVLAARGADRLAEQVAAMLAAGATAVHTVEFDADVRIDTPKEADYFRHGGILPYVLRRLLAE